ncbi:MAG: hypothetical protein V1648_02840 [Candidatus Aenigmatarchaeota archaeon]
MKLENMKYFGLSILAALFVINLALYTLKPLGDSFYIVADVWVAALAIMATLAGFFAFKIHGFKSEQGKAMLFIAVGTAFWTLGEITWGVLEIFTDFKPVVSIADIFWYAGYAFFIAGMFFICKLSSSKLGRKKWVLLPVVIAIAAASIFLIAPFAADTETPLLEKLASAGYIAEDMCLLISMAFGLTYLWGSKFVRPWSVIFLALMLSTCADIIYSYILGSYETGNIIDILWNTNYMLMATGFIYNRVIITRLFEAAKQAGASATDKKQDNS